MLKIVKLHTGSANRTLSFSMKIFTAPQIREGDAYTIRHEPVKSIELMERAASRCAAWIRDHFPDGRPVYVFCGTGNNGGDGLAIARLLHESGREVHSFLVFYSKRFSEDCTVNRTRLEHTFGSRLQAVYGEADFPEIPPDALVVDALFGTGLNRPLAGLAAEVVARINGQPQPVIAIDMPSGLMADESSMGHTVVRATHTLSFEFYKLAFLMPDNGPFTGTVHILPVGIHPGYIGDTGTPYYLVDRRHILTLYKKRNAFSHKGTYGHALLLAGSFGKMGAAVLASAACLRSGAGLLTSHIPGCGYLILQTALPEAMCICDPSEKHWTEVPDPGNHYSAIGVGPGIGRHPQTVKALDGLLDAIGEQEGPPAVIDADALNILGAEKALLQKIPAHSILTPHPREFERLFGETENNFDQLALQLRKSREHRLYIVLKGHYTRVTTPEGQCFFNSTGNAGMATAGSGDVLTGILTGLLAQGYAPLQAALFGVYLHGLAGDVAAKEQSAEAMIASDIIASLGNAFGELAAT